MKRIVVLGVLLGALVIPGCFNVQKRETIVMVEPGDVVEVVQEKKVKIRVVYKDDAGKSQEAIEEKNIAGSVAMPKSIYRKMRTSYILMADFINGKITEQEFRAQLQQSKAERGPEDDQKGK